MGGVIIKCYKQVKISIDTEIAENFKNVCAIRKVSMASVLSQYMCTYSNTMKEDKPQPDYSTKRRRLAAIKTIVVPQLEQIKTAAERSRDRIPDNLQSSINFEAAEQCVSNLEEAIELLISF